MTRYVIYPCYSTVTHLIYQAINVIENPRLRAIFLMLREDLKDEDIPHRTTIRARILQVWGDHLDTISEELVVRFNISTFLLSIDCYLEIHRKNILYHGHVE